MNEMIFDEINFADDDMYLHECGFETDVFPNSVNRVSIGFLHSIFVPGACSKPKPVC